jgi:hypothetical protein
MLKFYQATYCPAGAKYTSGGWSPSWVAPANPPHLKNRRISNIELRMSKYYVPCTGKNIYNEDRERPGMSGRSFLLLHSIFYIRYSAVF